MHGQILFKGDKIHDEIDAVEKIRIVTISPDLTDKWVSVDWLVDQLINILPVEVSVIDPIQNNYSIPLNTVPLKAINLNFDGYGVVRALVDAFSFIVKQNELDASMPEYQSFMDRVGISAVSDGKAARVIILSTVTSNE